jgi:4-hydroxymandelate oxidase
VTRELVRRAEASRYKAIVLTVDAPRLGSRERDTRNRFRLPDHITIRNLETAGALDRARWNTESSFFEYVHAHWEASLTWEAVSWLRSLTALPILLKGVLTADDAERAAAEGAGGIIVSNHGGRQLDGAVATIDALPDIAERVDGRLAILLDGGIRRGTDVLKALALGAQAVLIGRPYLWGLAVAGEEGVRSVLGMLRSELELAMALAGAPRIPDVTRSLVSPRRQTAV